MSISAWHIAFFAPAVFDAELCLIPAVSSIAGSCGVAQAVGPDSFLNACSFGIDFEHVVQIVSCKQLVAKRVVSQALFVEGNPNAVQQARRKRIGRNERRSQSLAGRIWELASRDAIKNWEESH